MCTCRIYLTTREYRLVLALFFVEAGVLHANSSLCSGSDGECSAMFKTIISSSVVRILNYNLNLGVIFKLACSARTFLKSIYLFKIRNGLIRTGTGDVKERKAYKLE